mmetsp:Transcript_22443/g.36206  ORF Transcript_22443/g.36206 Transcript_22443/m.36206 type:complete len:235 (+) Transcript_22443:4432-5136(+)
MSAKVPVSSTKTGTWDINGPSSPFIAKMPKARSRAKAMLRSTVCVWKIGLGCMIAAPATSGPSCLPAQTLASWRCSQGGAKFPTGGMWIRSTSPRAPRFFKNRGSSRSGETPEPTVIVRMKENAPGSPLARVRNPVRNRLGCDVSEPKGDLYDTHPFRLCQSPLACCHRGSSLHWIHRNHPSHASRYLRCARRVRDAAHGPKPRRDRALRRRRLCGSCGRWGHLSPRLCCFCRR